MSIVKNAVKESKDVARLAVDAAKNELIEQLTPTIKQIIDGQLRAGTLGRDVLALEGVNRMRQAADGYGGISDFEEGKDMKNKKDKMESVAALFPGVTEVSDVAESEDMDEAACEDNDDGHADMKESDEMGNEGDGMDETIEISESELDAMYAEALQLEVDVSKGFKDMAKPHELGAGAKYNNTTEPGSLEKLKSGEHEWDDELPPHKQDFIPEQLRNLVRNGVAENKALSEQNGQLREMVRNLHGKLTEMNLLNSKILHVNKFMTAHRLTAEQKKTVIESIDKGSTVKEVKSIYGILESSFKSAGAVNESTARRAPRADSQKRRTSGAPDTRVLRESADKAEGRGFSRWQHLAGLTNGKD
jgi:hypothetical protein